MSTRLIPTLFALAAGVLVLSLWLLTFDVYSDTGRQWAGQSSPASEPTFCGSAYDVALRRGDGFMGGELPVNQRAIDRECVPEAGRLVAMSAATGTLALATGAVALFLVIRRGQTPPTPATSMVGVNYT